MIVLLKMCPAGEIFSKICLPFFQYVVCDQGRNKGNQFFGWGNKRAGNIRGIFWAEGGYFGFLGMRRGEVPLSPPQWEALRMKIWYPLLEGHTLLTKDTTNFQLPPVK